MQRTQVSSTTIRSIGYDRLTSVLEVEFVRGGTYQYLDVPEFLFRGFLLTGSKGKYFNQRIQGRFQERCLTS